MVAITHTHTRYRFRDVAFQVYSLGLSTCLNVFASPQGYTSISMDGGGGGGGSRSRKNSDVADNRKPKETNMEVFNFFGEFVCVCESL